MAESETKTTFTKVVERVVSAARKHKANPEQVQEVMNRVYPERSSGAINLKEARSKQIIEGAKKFYTESKETGQFVALSEWIKENKFTKLDVDPEKALTIARQDLSIALKAAKLPPDNWIAREAANVKCAEAAQALSVVALAPENIRENPYFLFQTAAQLSGSNTNPEAQSTIKAFIEEMNRLKGKDGFDAETFDLRQMLTAEGGMSRVPRGAPDFDPATYRLLPANVQDIFRALNTQLAAARTDDQKYEILTSFTKQLEDIDTSGYTRARRDALSRLSIVKARKEAEFAPRYSKGLDESWFEKEAGITPHNKEAFHSRGLSESQIKDILAPPDEDGDAGIDKYVHSMMRRIFSSSREPRSPDLQEQSEYWEIEQLWRHLYGEDRAQTKLAELRSFWESEYRRSAINWHIVRGGSSNKDLIQKYFEGIPPDTMQHEQSILWGPEAISAIESAGKELAAEKRYTFDEGRRWFEQASTSVHGKTRLEAFGENALTGAEQTEALEWQRKIDNSNYITDKDAQFNESAFNNLANAHSRIEREYQSAKVHNPALTEEIFYGNYFARPLTAEASKLMETLQKEWREVTLFEHPENYIGDRLWNMEMLNKYQGLSPLQARAMIRLESMLKAKGIVIKDNARGIDKTWKLSRAISAATRSEVGSLRTVTLSHQMANMPAVLVATEGSHGVMNAPWQEQMGRVQDPEMFLRRFSLGGESQGQEIWANLITKELDEIGVKMERGDRFVPAQSKEESFGMRKVRTLLLKSRKYYGIGYTEMPRVPLGTSISLYEGTTWRFEPTLAKLEEVYAPLGPDAVKHVGMGMRRAINGGEKQEKVDIRRDAWEMSAKRTPSDLIRNFMTERTDGSLVTNGLIPGSEAWQQFNNVLSVVEHNIQTDERFIPLDIDLGTRGDFNTYFTDEVFQACNIMDPAEIIRLRDRYFDVIHTFKDTFLNNGGALGDRYIDRWAKTNFAITVSITDYDIKYTQWDKLPADHHYRRVVSDASGHLGVLDQMVAFHSRPELSQQPDSQKIVEADGLLKGAANSYTTTKEAERIMLTMDGAVTTYMESKNFYRWARTNPIVSTLCRQMVGLDTENKGKWWVKPIVNSVKPVLNFIANSPLFVRDAEERRVFNEILSADYKEWPRKFAQLHLGPTIAASGPNATAWDSIDVDKHFDDLEHAGLVISNHKLFNKMKDEHKSRVPWKLLALGQRYWWVPIVGTIAVGVIIAMEEQEIDSKHR